MTFDIPIDAATAAVSSSLRITIGAIATASLGWLGRYTIAASLGCSSDDFSEPDADGLLSLAATWPASHSCAATTASTSTSWGGIAVASWAGTGTLLESSCFWAVDSQPGISLLELGEGGA